MGDVIYILRPVGDSVAFSLRVTYKRVIVYISEIEKIFSSSLRIRCL